MITTKDSQPLLRLNSTLHLLQRNPIYYCSSDLRSSQRMSAWSCWQWFVLLLVSNNATPKRTAVSRQKETPKHANKTDTDRAKPSRKKRTMMRRLVSTKVCSIMQWCPVCSLDDDDILTLPLAGSLMIGYDYTFLVVMTEAYHSHHHHSTTTLSLSPLRRRGWRREGEEVVEEWRGR